ncbi:MAG: hypothetical protein WCC94_09730 [Candidatus Bathyarchaeia archaeon]
MSECTFGQPIGRQVRVRDSFCGIPFTDATPPLEASELEAAFFPPKDIKPLRKLTDEKVEHDRKQSRRRVFL